MRAAIEALKDAAAFIPNPVAAVALKGAATIAEYILDLHSAWEAGEEHREKLVVRHEELGVWGDVHPPKDP